MTDQQLAFPQAIRAIFFDAGFTLLRPSPSVVAICHTICRQHGLHLESDQLAQQLRTAENFFREAMQANPRTWASERAITDFWTAYYTALLRPLVAEADNAVLEQCVGEITREFRLHTRWELYPDVLPTLQALQGQGFTLGVISDWEFSLAAILRGLDLSQYFDCVLISAITRQSKPEPALYELALRRANAIGDYALHIGDSYIHDVLGARSVGMTPILLDRPGRLRQAEVDCLLIRDLREVLDLLEIPRPRTSVDAGGEQTTISNEE